MLVARYKYLGESGALAISGIYFGASERWGAWVRSSFGDEKPPVAYVHAVAFSPNCIYGGIVGFSNASPHMHTY